LTTIHNEPKSQVIGYHDIRLKKEQVQEKYPPHGIIPNCLILPRNPGECHHLIRIGNLTTATVPCLRCSRFKFFFFL
jgi:hypothetical protein